MGHDGGCKAAAAPWGFRSFATTQERPRRTGGRSSYWQARSREGAQSAQGRADPRRGRRSNPGFRLWVGVRLAGERQPREVRERSGPPLGESPVIQQVLGGAPMRAQVTGLLLHLLCLPRAHAALWIPPASPFSNGCFPFV